MALRSRLKITSFKNQARIKGKKVDEIIETSLGEAGEDGRTSRHQTHTGLGKEIQDPEGEAMDLADPEIILED